MNTMPDIQGVPVLPYDSTKELLTDLQNFSKVYERYISCNNFVANPSNSVLQCSADEMSVDQVNSAYNKLTDSDKGSFAKFNISVDAHKNHPNVNADDILGSYEKDIIKIRSEIASKMKILSDVRNSVKEDYFIKSDSTTYIGAALTIVLSSTLIYFFSQME
jgi:hypothetical protein